MTDQILSSQDNPEAAAAFAQDMFKPDAPVAPSITAPHPGFFTLPCGFVRGGLGAPAQYDAEVRELTGADEEYIDRVRRGKPGKLAEAIVERGLVSIGGEALRKDQIASLELADVEKILVEIRRSTYGDEFEYENLNCPHCGETFNLTLSVDDIPETRLGNSEDRVFEVDLKNGAKANVRLPRLSDVPEMVDGMGKSEYNTLLLAAVVLSIQKADGSLLPIAGSPDAARSLGLSDRTAIISALSSRRVGPDLNGVKFSHDTCGEEVPFPLSVGDLFPGL